MQQEEFESLVMEALDQLPEDIKARMENVDVVVQDWPTKYQLDSVGHQNRYDLLGLYEGIPLTGRAGYNMILPDKITIFQRPLEAICSSQQEIVAEVRGTVVHEIAHHFGIDDHRLHEMGR